MNSHLFSSSPFLSLVCFIWVLFVKIQLSSSNLYEACKIQFQCGNITAGYPFWGESLWRLRLRGCGHPELELNCEDDQGHLVTTMRFKDVKYRVLDIRSKEQTLSLARMDYLEPEGICSPAFPNITINSELFDYSDGTYENVTFLYDCPPSPLQVLPCNNSTGAVGHKNWSMKARDDDRGSMCDDSVFFDFFPVPKNSLNWTAIIDDHLFLRQVLDQGFELKWKLRGISCENCTNSKGSCGWNPFINETICFCPNQPNEFGSTNACPAHCSSTGLPSDCNDSSRPPDQAPTGSPDSKGSSFSQRRMLTLSLGIAAGVVGIIIILSMFAKFSKNKTENSQNLEAFVRNFGSLAPTRYSYSDVKKMTESFSNKLGQGGFGDVYKGKLPDDRLVAVKFLKESKGNGEEFTNEVASISRTSHVNIVNLLGFCYERTKRALIYEFMPNGSLDKFIYDQESSTTKSSLEWKTMYQIAVGIARGLEYLHRGCNTRIVHFDIKPHNILLDKDFCPKISDFGLAKLCKTKESIISMLGTRGTIGYIAPEVFCRNFGEVSHKSDVYSYGMMILEMVGGRKNIDVRVSHTSEIYFPNWIYKQLEPGNDFELHGSITEEEKELAKKMVLVSLWCIQTIPSDRPSMTRVVEMLAGGLECLQVPPKPSLASQTRSPQNFSAIASSSSAA